MRECVNALVGTFSREGAKAAKDGDDEDNLATWQERSSVRGIEAQSVNAATVINASVVNRVKTL
jgi:hypothetical protein